MSEKTERVRKVVDSIVRKKKRKKRDVIKGVNIKELRKGQKRRSSSKVTGDVEEKRKSDKKRKKDSKKGSVNDSAQNDGKKLERAHHTSVKLKQRMIKRKDGDVSLISRETGLNGNSLSYSHLPQAKEVFPGLDGRSIIAKRLREIYGGICSDMGGQEHMSTIEQALSKQVASLITIGEDMVAQRVIEDPEYDYLEHVVCVKTINQVGRTLGIKRRMKPVKEQSLNEFIEGEVEK